MNAFTESASRGKMRETVVTGATYGIFLTFGNAWSAFLQSLAGAIMPVRDDETEGSEVSRQLLYAGLTSLISVLVLVTMLRCHHYATRAERAIIKGSAKRLSRHIPRIRMAETDRENAAPADVTGDTRPSPPLRRPRKLTSRTRVRHG